MKFDKQVILIGAGVIGRRVLNILGAKSVYCFADSDKEKIGTEYCGKKVISFEDAANLDENYILIVSAGYETFLNIRSEFQNMVTGCVEYYGNALSIEDFSSKPELRKLKNIFKGKRCFLIGNGPSLKAEDLQKLYENNDITFATNKIHLIFGQTDWRPTVYCSLDGWAMYNSRDVIPSMEADIVLLRDAQDYKKYSKLYEQRKSNMYLFNMITKIYEDNNYIPFSLNPDQCIISGGGTVIADMVQWSVYMGINEIYLLGVDFNYENDGLKANHFHNEYRKQGEAFNPANESAISRMRNSFESIVKYSKLYGFKVYNATRGGRLETFERVEFDSLFK